MRRDMLGYLPQLVWRESIRLCVYGRRDRRIAFEKMGSQRVSQRLCVQLSGRALRRARGAHY